MTGLDDDLEKFPLGLGAGDEGLANGRRLVASRMSSGSARPNRAAKSSAWSRISWAVRGILFTSGTAAGPAWRGQ